MSDSTTPYALTREERHLLTRIEALEEAVLLLVKEQQRLAGATRVHWPVVGPVAAVRRFVLRKQQRAELMGLKTGFPAGRRHEVDEWPENDPKSVAGPGAGGR